MAAAALFSRLAPMHIFLLLCSSFLLRTEPLSSCRPPSRLLLPFPGSSPLDPALDKLSKSGVLSGALPRRRQILFSCSFLAGAFSSFSRSARVRVHFCFHFISLSYQPTRSFRSGSPPCALSVLARTPSSRTRLLVSFHLHFHFSLGNLGALLHCSLF